MRYVEPIYLSDGISTPTLRNKPTASLSFSADVINARGDEHATRLLRQVTSSKNANCNDHRDNNQDNSDTNGEDDGEDGKKGLRNGWRGGSPTRNAIPMLRLIHELLVHLLVVLQLLLMALLKVVLLLLYQPLLFMLVGAMMRHGGDILSPE